MVCPKCGAEQGEEKIECMWRGVIFAKLTQKDFSHDPMEINIRASGPTMEAGWTKTIKSYLLISHEE